PWQAPENAMSGSGSCESYTSVRLNASRSVSGIFRKKSQFLFSASRRAGCGAILMALCFTSVLLLAGQTSTQSWQPVQSTGAICSVYFISLKSFQRAAVDLNVTGAPSRLRESYTLARI